MRLLLGFIFGGAQVLDVSISVIDGILILSFVSLSCFGCNPLVNLCIDFSF